MSTQTLEKTKVEIAPADKAKVLFHNDDKTAMEMVVFILEKVFNKPQKEAIILMYAIHNEGKVIVAEYSDYEVAEQKADEGTTLARSYGYPLKITVEK